MKRREMKQLLKNLPRYYGIKTQPLRLLSKLLVIFPLLKNLPRYYGIKTIGFAEYQQIPFSPVNVKEPAQILWD